MHVLMVAQQTRQIVKFFPHFESWTNNSQPIKPKNPIIADIIVLVLAQPRQLVPQHTSSHEKKKTKEQQQQQWEKHFKIYKGLSNFVINSPHPICICTNVLFYYNYQNTSLFLFVLPLFKCHWRKKILRTTEKTSKFWLLQ